MQMQSGKFQITKHHTYGYKILQVRILTTLEKWNIGTTKIYQTYLFKEMLPENHMMFQLSHTSLF